jgi:3-hydroxy-3-methylglutaryl CoA synthase
MSKRATAKPVCFPIWQRLEGAFDDFLRRRPEAQDLDAYFKRNIYHLPFGGMGYRAHKAVLRRQGNR